MARTATKPTPAEAISGATTPDNEWGECSHCYKIRRSPGGIICEHRYWDAASWRMVGPCPGSFKGPAA
jgi:hypothetical protein